MIPRRLALFAVISTLLAAIAWTPEGRSAQAAPQAASAAPGQLSILNRKGETTTLCPLKHTDVTADIAGYVARVTVKQEFVNPSKEAVEAIYSFPLPNDAAVDDMTMTIGTRVVRGQIKRKEEAREIYETARASGQAAALLDQERPNIFTQQVANIMPGAKVVITISYINLLKYQEGQYEFVFPMVVGPRYIPGTGYISGLQRGAPSGTAKFEGNPGIAPVVVDAHRITPPIAPQGARAGHDISLTVRLDAGVPLQSLTAGQHKVAVARYGQSAAIVTLDNQQEIPNKDFILRYSAAGSEMAEGLLAYAPVQAVTQLRPSGSGVTVAHLPGAKAPSPVAGYFTMIVQPPAAPPQEQISPKEMVFVIDQTGSQSGWPIEKAKETMKYCIANMNPGDTFQLIGFNTSIYPCFPAPVPNTPENVAKALAFLAPIEGGGGTDILKSVDYALSLPDDPDRLRIVCYMTDGYVGNDMQIIDYIQKHRGRARMFPFGIGNSVNRFLIDSMAREGRGAAEYVSVNTNAGAQYGGPMPASGVKGAKECAERFYRRIASPLLLDVHVDWNGLPVEDVYPKQIPDVFTSGPITLKGRYTRAAEGDVTIHGLLRGKPWSRTIHVSLPAPTSSTAGNFQSSPPQGPDASAGIRMDAIRTLWAREKIEDLQNQDWLGAQSNLPHPEIQQEIINTALEYHLMSQYTSFVAVEQRVVNVGGRQRQLDVPVELPEGVPLTLAPADGKPAAVTQLQYSTGGFGAMNRSGAARQRGGSNLLAEFGVTGQVLANPDDNSIIAIPSAGAGGLTAGGTTAKRESLKDGESARSGRKRNAGTDAAKQLASASPLSRSASVGDDQGRKAKESRPLQAGKSDYRLFKDRATDLNDYLEGAKLPAEMTAQERRAALEKAKISPALREKLTAFRKSKGAKPEVVEVQVWVNGLTSEGLAKLKSLGFTLTATLTPHRLLLGAVALDKLDAMLNLPFVQLVEIPKFE